MTIACVVGFLLFEGPPGVLALPGTTASDGVRMESCSGWKSRGMLFVVVPLGVQLFGGTVLDTDTAERVLAISASDAVNMLGRGIRNLIWFLRWSASRWAEWLLRATLFFALTIVAPLLDPELVLAWREKGWRGARRSLLLGAAVHVRLLLDRRSPLVGKLAVVVALGYGVVSSDLLPDNSLPIGALDDVLAIVLASRGFMLLCPQSLVEDHAMRAASAPDRERAWQGSAG